MRELERCEAAIACSRCAAPKGQRCVYFWNNEPGVSAFAHPERKRDAARQWRVGVMIEVLNKHGIATTHGSDTPGAIEIANELEAALHPSRVHTAENLTDAEIAEFLKLGSSEEAALAIDARRKPRLDDKPRKAAEINSARNRARSALAEILNTRKVKADAANH